jgi:peptide deformylase
MILRITQYGEAILHQPGEKITRFDAGLAAFSRDLLDTMVAGDGIGLAAQQVGRALRMFVADLRSRAKEVKEVRHDGKIIPTQLLLPLIVVNPVVEFLGKETRAVNEGCLSFPEIRGDVVRPLAVRLNYQDIKGQRHVLETSGLLARVIQHEFDHNEGVLFIDRMDADHLAEIEPELKKLKRQTRAAMKMAAAKGG